MTTPSDYDLHGLEVDNLLAFLALMGLLRALETSEPDWSPKASWRAEPWLPRLHLATIASASEIAATASRGIDQIAGDYEVDGRANVSFEDQVALAEFARAKRATRVGADLVAALSFEHPPKRDGGMQVSPLVLMFGQGHQNFLERLVDVPRGVLPPRHRKAKVQPNFRDPAMIERALFSPWSRTDDADGFRWDPEDDQRYALRFGDPSTAGAAPTEHGANRLAAVGLLSFACVPVDSRTRPTTRGVSRGDHGAVFFTWPVWRRPLGRTGIERLLSHEALLGGDLATLRPLGVDEIYRARKVSNGKFANIGRATAV